MIIEEHDLLDKYRRLRILTNRIAKLQGTEGYYENKYSFATSIWDREVLFISCPKFVGEEDTLYFHYSKDTKILFVIQINHKRYDFLDKCMNEEQAWLAIHELEELSYKELELYETV